VYRGLCVKMTFALFSTLQLKSLFCQKLAACLCMKPSPCPSLEPSLTFSNSQRVSTQDNCTDNPHGDKDSVPFSQPAENDSVKKLLREIRDLLNAQIHKQIEQCYEDDKEDKMKHDWILAAAVIDRICAIAFTIFIIGGTLVFFILFATHP